MKQRNKVGNKVLKSFETIYQASHKIAKKWGKESISLPTLRRLLDVAMVKVKEIKAPEAQKFVQEYENVLKSLFSECEKAAKKYNSDDVSLEYLRNAIDTIKVSFSEEYYKKK